MLSNVSCDVGSTRHVVEGWLRRNGTGAGVDGKSVTVSVNDTRYGFTTGQYGHFALDRDFPPVEDQNTTYAITALFEGDQPVNATAWANAMDGTCFAACTTTQFGYKPAFNSTSIRVEPPVTEKTVPTKSPEEMQKEAETDGGLMIWHEFSWWFPWYRCHLKIKCTLPQGQLYMDYGWSPLPFGQTFECNAVAALIINDLANKVYGTGQQVLWDFVKGYIVGQFIQLVASAALGKTVCGVVVAVLAYIGYCALETYNLYRNSGNDPCAWLAAFLSSAFGGTLGLLKEGLNKVVGFITAAGRRLLGEISHIMNSFWARTLDFFNITGIAFALVDFAFSAYDLVQYKTLVG